MLPKKNTVSNGFNYQKYLYYHSIYYILNANRIKIIEKNNSVLYYTKNKFFSRAMQIDSTGYIMTFLLGDKGMLDLDMMNVYRENGVSHLFAISGMHIGFIVSVLLFFLDKITYKNQYKYGILSIVLLYYLFLTSFSASVCRAVIMFILDGINKSFNFKIKKIDIMLLTLIVACFFNSFIIYDIGFQFSYVISFSLILFSKKFKSKIIQSLYNSFLCFLVSIPICIYYFYQTNILSILFNLVMIPFVSIIVFPMSLLSFAIPIVLPFYYLIIRVLESINIFVSHFSIFIITFPKINTIFVFIIYFIIFLVLRNIKFLSILFLLLFLLKAYPYCFSSYIVSVLDVGQGDSILISFPRKEATFLIDTGGKINIIQEEWKKRKKNFSYTDSVTIPYLQSLDIHHLDYLILSHGDYDHMGEAINLVENFKVEKVIFNCGEFNDLEKKLINVLDKNNIKYYSCVKELNIDNNKLYFLQTKEYDNENDNSNVIYTEFNGYKFMFMGDASINTEKEIMSIYNLPNIDVLKIGHHGSKTSSGREFIDGINPKYSIISVGKNNKYGHPNKEVLNNLENSRIYRTDMNGSIVFKIKNNKLKIETCAQ